MQTEMAIGKIARGERANAGNRIRLFLEKKGTRQFIVTESRKRKEQHFSLSAERRDVTVQPERG